MSQSFVEGMLQQAHEHSYDTGPLRGPRFPQHWRAPGPSDEWETGRVPACSPAFQVSDTEGKALLESHHRDIRQLCRG